MAGPLALAVNARGCSCAGADVWNEQACWQGPGTCTLRAGHPESWALCECYCALLDRRKSIWQPGLQPGVQSLSGLTGSPSSLSDRP
eukprot:316613-Chlamydomonas_euryale.AAC.1